MSGFKNFRINRKEIKLDFCVQCSKPESTDKPCCFYQKKPENQDEDALGKIEQQQGFVILDLTQMS